MGVFFISPPLEENRYKKTSQNVRFLGSKITSIILYELCFDFSYDT